MIEDNPDHLIVLCGPHHAATHQGRLHIEGDAPTGWSFRHVDGTTYGAAPPSAELADAAVNVFHALRSLGFRERDCKKAIAQVRGEMKTHVGNAQRTEHMLRAALRLLTAASNGARGR